MERRLRHADDGERGLALARARPSHRAALRVGVDKENPRAGAGEARGKIDGDGRLADASFLVENADDHQDAFLQLKDRRNLSIVDADAAPRCCTAI